MNCVLSGEEIAGEKKEEEEKDEKSNATNKCQANKN